MSAADSKAVEHLTVEDININLAMKKVYCVLPPGVLGSNEYFNDGDGEAAFCLHLSWPQHAHHLYFRNKPHFEWHMSTSGISICWYRSRWSRRAQFLWDGFGGIHRSKVKRWWEDLDHQSQNFEGHEKVKKSASTYCLDQFDSMYSDRDKGVFICFQVAINSTAKQYDICPNIGSGWLKGRERKHLQRGIASGTTSPNCLVSLLRWKRRKRPSPRKSLCLLIMHCILLPKQ